MGAADRRIAYRDEVGSLRSRVTRARRRLEESEAHELASKANIDNFEAFRLYEAVRDALDILNKLPEGYWRKKPGAYRPLMEIDDLGNDVASSSPSVCEDCLPEHECPGPAQLSKTEGGTSGKR